MAVMRVPAVMQSYFDGKSEISLAGATVGEAMHNLVQRYPNVKPHFFDSQNQVRRFVNLFINGENILDLQGLDTALKENDKVILHMSVAGG